MSRGERFYRRSLYLYPRRFRDTYGTELLQVFRARYARTTTPISFWIGNLTDTFWNAALVRLRRSHITLPRVAPDKTRRVEMTAILRDVRYASRAMLRQPMFALIVVLTLGLGIGTTTAIFTLVNGVLLAPLPYPESDGLVRVWEHDTNEDRLHRSLSPADFHDYSEQATTLTGLAAFTSTSTTWTEEGEAERIPAQLVTPNFFEVLGVAPLLGRTLRAGDELEQVRHTVLSYGFWQSRLGGDSSIIGSTIQAGSSTLLVVGIMPATFRAPDAQHVDLWGSWNLADDNRRAVHFVSAIGRVHPETTVEAVRAELRSISLVLETEYPDVNSGHYTTVLPLADAVLGDVRAGLWLLFAAVGAVLLVACANLANLFLSRGIARSRELALRTALGAGRGRLLSHLITESAVLGLVGGALGLTLASIAIRAFVALDPGTVPRIDQVQINFTVGAFAVAVLAVTTMVFGGGPALLTTRQHPASTLRQGGGRGLGTPAGQRIRGGLVILQLALAVILLLGAGLLLRSFDRLTRIDPGFSAETVLAGRVALDDERYGTTADIVRFQDELRTRLESDPSVQGAGTVTFLPFAGGSATSWLNIVGRPPWDGVPPEVNLINVSGNYFDAIGTTLMAGRTFDEQDHEESPPVVVINQTAAQMYWENENPVGAQIRLGPNPESTPLTIIGVVGGMRQYGLSNDPFPAAFTSSRQGAWSNFYIVVQTTGNPVLSAAPLRRHTASLDPELAIFEVEPMTERISASVARPRFSVLVLGIFAGTALVLAAVGVYGVVAYSVTVRSHEFGVRIALGASKSRVMSLVMRQAIRLAGVAVAIGVAIGVAGSRVLRNVLFEIDPVDPVTFIAMPVLLFGVALLAAWQPARRALGTDPIIALRAE